MAGDADVPTPDPIPLPLPNPRPVRPRPSPLVEPPPRRVVDLADEFRVDLDLQREWVDDWARGCPPGYIVRFADLTTRNPVNDPACVTPHELLELLRFARLAIAEAILRRVDRVATGPTSADVTADPA